MEPLLVFFMPDALMNADLVVVLTRLSAGSYAPGPTSFPALFYVLNRVGLLGEAAMKALGPLYLVVSMDWSAL